MTTLTTPLPRAAALRDDPALHHTSGADIVAALALGADSVLVGRAYLYGLMAGGELGVLRAAEILTDGIRRTMALLGASSVAALGPQHVRLP